MGAQTWTWSWPWRARPQPTISRQRPRTASTFSGSAPASIRGHDPLLAVGTQLGVGAVGGVLGVADAGGDGQTLLEQAQQLVVDGVDLGAQGGQRHLFGRQVFGHVGPDLLERLDWGMGSAFGWVMFDEGAGARRRSGPERSPARLSGAGVARGLSRRIESRRNDSQNRGQPRANGAKGSTTRRASGDMDPVQFADRGDPWPPKTRNDRAPSTLWRSDQHKTCAFSAES